MLTLSQIKQWIQGELRMLETQKTQFFSNEEIRDTWKFLHNGYVYMLDQIERIELQRLPVEDL